MRVAHSRCSPTTGTTFPELTDVRRFRADWEKTASLHLRTGDPAAVDAYGSRERIIGGDLDTVSARAFAAWRADVDAGRVSVLVADTSETVRELNLRARADRIRAGAVDPGRSVRLHDGSDASAGDVVVTRRNDRHLLVGRRGWVRNGDRWTVLRSHATAQWWRVGSDGGGAPPSASLPTTRQRRSISGTRSPTHRAQGLTVDTGHVIVTARSTREAAYVGMTRGRDSNTAYVATDERDDDHTAPRPTGHRDDDQQAAARAVLTEVLARSGAELSAHDTLRHEQDTATSVRVLAAEYDTIATAAQHDRWVALIHASPLAQPQAEAVVASDAFGVLGQALRRAEADHHSPEALLSRIVAAGPLDDATDIAAVLTARLERAPPCSSGAGGGRGLHG